MEYKIGLTCATEHAGMYIVVRCSENPEEYVDVAGACYLGLDYRWTTAGWGDGIHFNSRRFAIQVLKKVVGQCGFRDYDFYNQRYLDRT